MIPEAIARKAVGVYFSWYAAENGVAYHAEYSKLRVGGDEHMDKRGWTFRMVYGGRPVFIREVLPGRIEVWRQDMPKGTFKVSEITEKAKKRSKRG